MTEHFYVLNNDRTLRGTLHIGINEVPIMIVHGYFSANKIGAHRLYVEMANYLAQMGFSVLRIDLSGMGESDGDLSLIDFSEHVSDVTTIATQLMKYIDSKKVHFIGHCIGSCTALESAMQNKKFVKSLTLISPFMPSKKNHIKLLMSKERYQELQSTGLTLRKGLVCRKSFIDAGFIITKYPLFCKQSEIDSIVYFSGNDEMVSIDECVAWASSNNLQNRIFLGADHNYINPLARRELFFELGKRFKSSVTRKT